MRRAVARARPTALATSLRLIGLPPAPRTCSVRKPRSRLSIYSGTAGGLLSIAMVASSFAVIRSTDEHIASLSSLQTTHAPLGFLCRLETACDACRRNGLVQQSDKRSSDERLANVRLRSATQSGAE